MTNTSESVKKIESKSSEAPIEKANSVHKEFREFLLEIKPIDRLIYEKFSSCGGLYVDYINRPHYRQYWGKYNGCKKYLMDIGYYLNEDPKFSVSKFARLFKRGGVKNNVPNSTQRRKTVKPIKYDPDRYVYPSKLVQTDESRPTGCKDSTLLAALVKNDHTQKRPGGVQKSLCTDARNEKEHIGLDSAKNISKANNKDLLRIDNLHNNSHSAYDNTYVNAEVLSHLGKSYLTEEIDLCVDEVIPLEFNDLESLEDTVEVILDSELPYEIIKPLKTRYTIAKSEMVIEPETADEAVAQIEDLSPLEKNMQIQNLNTLTNNELTDDVDLINLFKFNKATNKSSDEIMESLKNLPESSLEKLESKVLATVKVINNAISDQSFQIKSLVGLESVDNLITEYENEYKSISFNDLDFASLFQKEFLNQIEKKEEPKCPIVKHQPEIDLDNFDQQIESESRFAKLESIDKCDSTVKTFESQINPEPETARSSLETSEEDIGAQMACEILAPSNERLPEANDSQYCPRTNWKIEKSLKRVSSNCSLDSNESSLSDDLNDQESNKSTKPSRVSTAEFLERSLPK